MEMQMSLPGVTEIRKDFDTLIRKYPDAAGDYLQKTGRQLRKDVIQKVKKDTKTKGKGKKSLSKAGAYRISKPLGINEKQYVEVSGVSPHFHLVEHGHNLIINGENRGFVPGKHMMADTAAEYERKMPEIMDQMVDALLKESGMV